MRRLIAFFLQQHIESRISRWSRPQPWQQTTHATTMWGLRNHKVHYARRSRSLSSPFSMCWQAKCFIFHLNRASACHKQVGCVHWIHWSNHGDVEVQHWSLTTLQWTVEHYDECECCSWLRGSWNHQLPGQVFLLITQWRCNSCLEIRFALWRRTVVQG